MDTSQRNAKALRKLVSEIDLHRQELSLEEAVLDKNSKLLIRPRSLSAGLAIGPLISFREYSYTFDRGVSKPIVFCESCRDMDLPGLDQLGGLVIMIGDITSHLVVRANSLSIPVVCVDDTQAETLRHFIGSECITLIACREEAAMFIGVAQSKIESNWELLANLARGSRSFRGIEVRANIDDRNDAQRAIRAGADGVGTWRIENYLGRLQFEHILHDAAWDAVRGESFDQSRSMMALSEILVSELCSILEQLQGLPLVVRLLDIPLARLLRLTECAALPRSLCINISKGDPVFSVRGARLGVIYPAIAELQLRSIVIATSLAVNKGTTPNIALQIPFVTHASEIGWYRRLFSNIASEFPSTGAEGNLIKIGITIETPRAAITAAELARGSDFFCFGTNDLTQYTWALDRDSGFVEIIGPYIKQGLLDGSPFSSLDSEGVGAFIEYAVSKGRSANPSLKIGITGVLGNRPEMINYFRQLKFDYVSVSIPQLPLVALSYAQEFLKEAE